jgi:hypothetical protein
VNESTTAVVIPATIPSAATQAAHSALYAESDRLNKELDGSLRTTREKAREWGRVLLKIKQTVYKNNHTEFAYWFQTHYKRTAQSAMQYMRLDKVWEQAEKAHAAKDSPAKGTWENLSIQETLKLVAKPRASKGGEGEEKDEAKPEPVASAKEPKTIKVKRGQKVRIGNEWLEVTEPVLFVPDAGEVVA